MDQETLFRNQLAALVKTARQQGMYLSKEQILDSFPELGADAEKLKLIQDYLENMKVSIGKESAMEQFLSEEDKNYLEEYMKEASKGAKVTPEEKKEIILSAMADAEEAKARLLEIYLPDVASIAKLYTGQGVFLEDLIGEGNVALISVIDMLHMIDAPEEADGFVGKFIMDAMEQFLSQEDAAKELDDKILERVNAVALAAKNLAQELRRKVSVSELFAETDFTMEEIEEAVLVSGGQIEDLEG